MNYEVKPVKGFPLTKIIVREDNYTVAVQTYVPYTGNWNAKETSKKAWNAALNRLPEDLRRQSAHNNLGWFVSEYEDTGRQIVFFNIAVCSPFYIGAYNWLCGEMFPSGRIKFPFGRTEFSVVAIGNHLKESELHYLKERASELEKLCS